MYRAAGNQGTQIMTEEVSATSTATSTNQNSESTGANTPVRKPGQATTVTAKKNPLAGTSWIWKDTSFNNKSAPTMPANTKFVITFGTDGAMTSTTDCNSISGRYAVNDDKINIAGIVSTKMACEGQVLESTYVSQLTQITNFTFESLNELDLTTVNGSATMSFTRR